MGRLYIIGTPIGNLQDITLRGLETLKSVDVIACEDTRHSRKLLNKYEIKKHVISCHGYNEGKSTERIVELLREGKDVGYISDAGTPALSDPGALLVGRVREAGEEIVPIPGPFAAATLLSVSGHYGKTVIFEGFLSPKQGRRRKRLRELLDLNYSFLLYESPFRIVKLIRDLADIEPERQIFLGREMTKIHEEFLHGAASDVLAGLETRESIKGEFSLLVFNRKKS
jgi:16S rRNA (cytidine1402-2'-O)-methyltransferase